MKTAFLALLSSFIFTTSAFAHPVKVESNGCAYYTSLGTTADPSQAPAIQLRGNLIGQSSGMQFLVPTSLLPLKDGTDVTYQAEYTRDSSIHLLYSGGMLKAKVTLPDNYSVDNLQIKIDPMLTHPSAIQYKRFFVLNPFKPVEQFNCTF